MSSSDDFDIPEPWWEERTASRSWGGSGLAWLGVAAVTFLIFELTSSSSLALAVGCLKFAWHDFVVARKIRQVDADRVRSWTCAWFHRAWGLMKVSLIAMVLMFVLLFVGGHFNQLGRAEFASKVLTALAIGSIGFNLSLIFSGIGVFSGLRHRIKVWIGASTNRIKLLMLGNIITLFILLMVFLIMIPLALADRVAPWVGGIVGIGIGVGIPIIGAIGILGGLAFLAIRLEAQSIEECWPTPLDLDARPLDIDPFASDAANRARVIE
jgi:hypothetical protein